MPTVINKVVKYSGGDYTDIQTAINATPSNLVTADEQWNILIDESASGNFEWVLAAALTMPARTTDATRFICIKPNANTGFGSNANKLTNALRYNASNGVALKCASGNVIAVSVNYTEIIGLQLWSTNSETVTCTGGNVAIKNCIIRNSVSTGLGYYSMAYIQGGNSNLINTLFYSDGDILNGVSIEASGCSIVNCNIYSGAATSNGIRLPSNVAVVVKNTGVFNYANVFDVTSSASSSSSNIGTSATSVGVGTSHQTSLTTANQFTLLTAGSEDFRTKAGAALINNGIRQQTYTNDLDIVGSARSITTPTIGAWEFAGAPTAPSGVTAGSVTAFAVTANWTDNSSTETGFKVQYAPSPYSSWTAFSGSPTAANATTLASGNVLTPSTSYKIRVASTNANGDSAYVESGVFTTTPLTFLRPIADTSNGAWTASSGSDRYAMIDESATNDADYITVSSASTYKTRLTTVSDPGVNTDHSVVVRAKGDGTSQLTIALVQGDPTETAIASTTVTPTVSYADYTLTVTSGQAANITDYSLLYLKLTSL
jgi:hypothetical protein